MFVKKSINPPLLAISLAIISLFTVACSNDLELVGRTASDSFKSSKPATIPAFEPEDSPTPFQDVPKCHPDLTLEECKTLNSLTLIDDHPLYTMHYYGSYEALGLQTSASKDQRLQRALLPSWGCSLFAAFGDEENQIYGRNFDWRFSPAILLFTHPEDGYESVSMVDYEYLGFTGSEDLNAVPIEEKFALLLAPLLPFDGMNERGLVVGMAAVPPGQGQPDPRTETIDSLGIIREMLDHAGDVSEAVGLFESYNIDMGNGPPLHYLLADAAGRSALLEFHNGDLVVILNDQPWKSATNFLESPVKEDPEGQCWRNDLLDNNLEENQGAISAMDGLALLDDVSQANTQWSIIYDISRLDIALSMGREYANIYNFQLREP